MAKKKGLQQLDLFGSLFTDQPVVENEVKIEEPSTTYVTDTTEIPEKTSTSSHLVFSDDKIGVKIKLKQEPTPIKREEEQTEKKVEEKIIEAPETTSSPKPIVAEKPIVTKTVVKKPKKEKAETLSKRGRKSFREMDAEVELVNVPDEQTLKQKLYYPIREVAGFFNVNTSLIRAWETEFDILQPRKNRKGDRLFRAEDIKNLQVIYYLLRNKKFSIDGAKKYLKENRGKLDTNQQIVQSLTKFRAFLVEMKANLQA